MRMTANQFQDKQLLKLSPSICFPLISCELLKALTFRFTVMHGRNLKQPFHLLSELNKSFDNGDKVIYSHVYLILMAEPVRTSCRLGSGELVQK